MIRLLLLIFALLIPLSAHAEALRITLLLSAGQDVTSFTLNDADSHSFRERWSQLPPSAQMVPVAPDGSYHGVILRGDNNEFRLYNGIGRNNNDGKQDDLRMLERWVLEHAPPPLGISLVAALDADVSARGDDMAASLPHSDQSAAAILLRCTSRNGTQNRLRANCLHEELTEKLDAKTYADALAELVKRTDKTASQDEAHSDSGLKP